MQRKLICPLLAASVVLVSTGASATESISYTYDARGRLVQVARAGSINNGVTTVYTHDKADNRSSKSTTGSPNPGPP